MSKCIYCGKEWLTNLSKYTYEDVCNECKNKYGRMNKDDYEGDNKMIEGFKNIIDKQMKTKDDFLKEIFTDFGINVNKPPYLIKKELEEKKMNFSINADPEIETITLNSKPIAVIKTEYNFKEGKINWKYKKLY